MAGARWIRAASTPWSVKSLISGHAGGSALGSGDESGSAGNELDAVVFDGAGTDPEDRVQPAAATALAVEAVRAVGVHGAVQHHDRTGPAQRPAGSTGCRKRIHPHRAGACPCHPSIAEYLETGLAAFGVVGHPAPSGPVKARARGSHPAGVSTRTCPLGAGRYFTSEPMIVGSSIRPMPFSLSAWARGGTPGEA